MPLVGTLNLCLEKPNSMKKVWAQSDQCEPRKSPKTIENLLFWQFPKFWHILDVFSAQDDPIELKPFPLNQASRDTSLKYQQGALWSTLKCQYFSFWPTLSRRSSKLETSIMSSVSPVNTVIIFGLCLLVRNRHFDNDINQGLNDQMQPFNCNLTLGCFFLLNIWNNRFGSRVGQ